MKDRPQCVRWDFGWRKDKWTKVPYRPSGKKAEPDNPRTWSKFDSARSYWTEDGESRGEEYAGIGYMFAEDDSYTGIDLDDAIDGETKQLKPWAQPIVDQLNSYTEISPSGTGVKIWVNASKPSNDRSRTKYENGEIEVYDLGRYFAVTGEHWPGTPRTIEERQAEVDALYQQFFAKPEKKKSQRDTKRTRIPQQETRSLADDELIEKATAAKNGDEFARLFAGDTSDYNGDESAAEQAFCNMLAFWTNKDTGQMDRIYRSSALFRDKWDEKRGESTYGQRTINEACDFVQETYAGKRTRVRIGSPSKKGNGHDDVNSTTTPGKPTIILDVDEFRVNTEAIEALSDTEAAPEVY